MLLIINNNIIIYIISILLSLNFNFKICCYADNTILLMVALQRIACNIYLVKDSLLILI